MTLTDYVNANRIEYAKKLLRSTLLPVQDVAAACGIPDVHYFTRLFRRITGMTPREWETLKTGHGMWQAWILQIYCICLFRTANRRRESETQNGVFLIYTAFGISDDPCFSKL